MQYRVEHLKERTWFKVRVWRTPEKHRAIRELLKKVLPNDAYMCQPVRRDTRVDRRGNSIQQNGMLIMLATFEDVITARLACDLLPDELIGWDEDWAERHEKSSDFFLMFKYHLTPKDIARRRYFKERRKEAKKLACNK
jgi:hypothetical protein